MQRACAILLLAILSFPLIGPAMFADADSKVPACCRRQGKHHCASMGAANHNQAASPVAVKAVGQKCPYFPKTVASPAYANTVLLSPSQTYSASIVTYLAVVPQTEARQRISFSRSRQKRAPPASLS